LKSLKKFVAASTGRTTKRAVTRYD